MAIEAQTQQRLSIATRPTAENLEKCNPQSQSPLFTTIPAEIRNQIFAFALLQYEDFSEPYEEHDYCYRPGHRARRIVSTSLLLTCRRVWLEANHCPMSQATHAFWFEQNARRPAWTKESHASEDNRFRALIDSLTLLHRRRVRHLHVFAQMYWLEQSMQRAHIWTALKKKSLKLDSFTVTIRHSDWWNWESNQPLRFSTDWLVGLLQSEEATARQVAEFHLELETLADKIDQLRPIIANIKATVADSNNQAQDEDEDKRAIETPKWDFIAPSSGADFESTSWSGPITLGGKVHDVYRKREQLDYVVATLRWKLRSVDWTQSEAFEKRWREEGSLLKLVGRKKGVWRPKA